jgi:hypothetical protein
MRQWNLFQILGSLAIVLLPIGDSPRQPEQTPRYYAEARVMSSEDDCCFELLIMVHEIGTTNMSDMIRAYGTMMQGPCCGEMTGRIMDSPLMRDNTMQRRSITRLLEFEPRLMEQINRAAASAIRNVQLQRGGPFRRFEISPERVFSTATLFLESTRETNVIIRISDFNGEVVKDFGQFVAVEGNNEFHLSLKELGPGFYFVKIRQGERIYTLPIEKQG